MFECLVLMFEINLLNDALTCMKVTDPVYNLYRKVLTLIKSFHSNPFSCVCTETRVQAEKQKAVSLRSNV